jgi:amidophosphoribosyltransferase
MFDKLRDHCGVVGVFGHSEASTIAYLGLHALQHRGQESAGVVSSNNTQLFRHRGMGLVADVFTPAVLETLPGERAIGHVRYSTAGQSVLDNAQPFMIREQGRQLSIAHNGNLVNADELRVELEEQGSIFASSTDTEVILHLIAREKDAAIETRIARALHKVEGAYSLVFLTPEKLIAVRDPHGFRPLVLGQLRGGGWIVASETCAFNLVEAEYVREIEPGEIVIVDEHGLRSTHMPAAEQGGRCIFELIYFSRPDSKVFDRSVYAVRRELGRVLARTQPAEVDVVVPVPDSGVAGALGFAEQMGVPFELGLIRSHYVGRTFIEPSQSIRNFGVKLKLSVVHDVVRGKRVAVIDDSLVRGTTSRKIVSMLRAAGAKEVHLRITAPPTKFPCYYGIDTPNQSELLAANQTVPEIARYVTADSIGYLTLEKMHEAARSTRDKFCDACFSGDYRIPVGEARKQLVALKTPEEKLLRFGGK